MLCAVRGDLRYSLSFRDVEALFRERGLEADHTTIWRGVQRDGPALEERRRRHLKPTHKSWRGDEPDVRVTGGWCDLSRALDATGAAIDFVLSALREAAVAKRLCRQALSDSRSERGRHLARPLPTSAGPLRDQHRGAGSSSDQTARDSQAGLSCIPRVAADDPGRRSPAHDLEGAGEVGERFGCSATDSVHQDAARRGGMRRSRGDLTNRARVAF